MEITEIFAGALELEERERPDYLMAACNGDDFVIKEVIELLNENAEAESECFLVNSALEIEAESFATKESTR